MLMTFSHDRMPPRKGSKGKGSASKAAASEGLQIPDGYVQLPHNMGLMKVADTQAGNTMESASNDQEAVISNTRYALRSRKTSNTSQTKDKVSLTDSKADNEEPPMKRQRTKEGGDPLEDDKGNQLSKDSATSVASKKRMLKQVKSPYQTYTSVPWGETPWPEFVHPSAADCETLYSILHEEHANGNLSFERPVKIPPPSLEIAGCGETQLLLDGMIRTIMSGATTMNNANNAIKSVSDFYGTVTKSVIVDGEEITPVKDAIDWNKVRLLGVDEFKRRIRTGGLQEKNSKAVIAILEKIHGWNAERAAAFTQEKATGIPANIPGAEKLTQKQKDMEIWMFENDVISLEHIRSLSAEEVMHELIQLSHVGVKTAACVLLFCLQEPCFAVDTHCFRLAQWLGWLPKDLKNDSGRDKAFAHLDLRIPDHLKYGLHQLFIEHGKECHKCKANTKEGTKEWKSYTCPLDHLLERIKREDKKSSSKRKAGTMEKESGQGVEKTDDRTLDESGNAEAVFNPGLQGDTPNGDGAEQHTGEEGDKEAYTETERPGPSKKRAPSGRRPQKQDNSAYTAASLKKHDDAAGGSADGPAQGV